MGLCYYGLSANAQLSNGELSAMGNGSACMAQHLNHVAIAVEDMDEALDMYASLFGLDPSEVEDVKEQGVRAALLKVGGSQVELIQPLDTESGVAKFIERRGPGLHHICFEVDGLQGALDRLDAEPGVQLIDRHPRQGLAGMIAFLHPKSTGGTLIELVEAETAHK